MGVVCGAEVVVLAILGGAGLSTLLLNPSIRSLGAAVIVTAAVAASWLVKKRRRGGPDQSALAVDETDSSLVKSST